MRLYELYLFTIELGHVEEKQLSTLYRSCYVHILAHNRNEAIKYAEICAKKGGGYWRVQDCRGPQIVNATNGKRVRLLNGKVVKGL